MACGLLVSQGVVEEEGGCLGVAVEAVGRHVVAEEATTRREMRDVPNGCAEASNGASNGVLSYLLVSALLCFFYGAPTPDRNYPVGPFRCYFLLLWLCVSSGQVLWLARGFVARLSE